jgi:hypothetical protein
MLALCQITSHNHNHHIAAKATIATIPKAANPQPPARETAPPVAGTTVHVELATEPTVVAGIVAILTVALLAGVAAIIIEEVAVPLLHGAGVIEVDMVVDISISVQLQSITVVVVAL